jgi:hypothetical protein
MSCISRGESVVRAMHDTERARALDKCRSTPNVR